MATLDSCAVEIMHGLEHSWPDTDLVRLMAQAVDGFQRCEPEQREIFLKEPRLTGDIRWDAALAALAVHLCRWANLDRTPAWTRSSDRFNPGFFWVGLGKDTTLQAYVFQRTPAYFKGRGIMLNTANLESV